MVGSTALPLDRYKLQGKALAWVPSDPDDGYWSLVSIVVIWRSGCSLTKPLQWDGKQGNGARVDREKHSLEVLFGDGISIDNKIKAMRFCIVFAHLLFYRPDCIQSMDLRE